MDILGFRLYFHPFINSTPVDVLRVMVSFALAVFVIYLIVRNWKKGTSFAPVLKILRVVTILTFFFVVILEPVVVRIENKGGAGGFLKPPLYILMDFSKSMIITRRKDESVKWLESNLPSLASNFDVKIFTFAGDVKDFPTEKFSAVKNLKVTNPHLSDGDVTDIEGAIRYVSSRHARSRLPSVTGDKKTLSASGAPAQEGVGGTSPRFKKGGGILLISDGINTAPYRGEEDASFLKAAGLHEDEEDAASGERFSSDYSYGAKDGLSAGESQLRVFALDIFSGKNIDDVSITSLSVSPYAFKGKEIPVFMNIRKKRTAGGGGGFPLKVNIEIKSLTPLESKELAMTEPSSPATGGARKNGKEPGDACVTDEMVITRELSEGDNGINFNLPPSNKTGRVFYKVSVSTFPWEVTTLNNTRDFSVDILRDKVRVLYLCGRPSYEYSFLRDFIKNDMSFELVTFVILRNPDDVALVPDEELALIPFPGADLMVKQLNDFDVVIFENFTYQRFGIFPQHLEMIKKWVASGGGFLMIAGENSFSSGGYDRTPMAEILPVKMESGVPPQIETELFSPVFPPANSAMGFKSEDFVSGWFYYRHAEPLKLTAGKEDDLRTVKLPPLDWIEKLKPSDDAIVPLYHPWVKVDNLAAPLLAFKFYGKGRAGALMTDSTWRWKMNPGSADMAFLYESFWKAVLSYLASSSGDESEGSGGGGPRVIGLKKIMGAGEICNFIVKKRLPSSRLSVIVTAPDGSKKVLEPVFRHSSSGIEEKYSSSNVSGGNLPPSESVRKYVEKGDIYSSYASGYVMFSFGGSEDTRSTPAGGLKGRYFFEITDENPLKNPKVKRETFAMTITDADHLSYDENLNSRDSRRELINLEPDVNYLKNLAAKTGGEYITAAPSKGGVEESSTYAGAFNDVLLKIKRRLSQEEEGEEAGGGTLLKTHFGGRRGGRGGNEDTGDIGKQDENTEGQKVIYGDSGYVLKDSPVFIVVIMILIIAELILRRVRYGLW